MAQFLREMLLEFDGAAQTLARDLFGDDPVVDQYCGRTDLATEVGQDTTFFVRLPLRTAGDPTAS